MIEDSFGVRHPQGNQLIKRRLGLPLTEGAGVSFPWRITHLFCGDGEGARQTVRLAYGEFQSGGLSG